jgi:hypothetical protein
MTIQLLLLGLTIVFFSAYHLRRQKRFFNLAVFFNAYSFLYFFVGIQIYDTEILKGGGSTELDLLTNLSTLAVICFNLFYLLTSKSYRKNQTEPFGYIPKYQTLVLVTAFGLAVEIVVIGLVGPYNFFFITRLDRFPILKQYQHLLFITNIINIALPFALARYFTTKSQKDKRLALFILLHNLSLAVLLISRSALAYNFICLFFFLEAHKIITRKTIAITGIALAFAMFFYKGILYGLILGAEYELYSPGEFINWIRNSITIISNNITAQNLPNNSYILATKSLFIPSPSEEALSEWFIKEYYSARAVAGLTYGFSGLIEGYIYLKHIGVAIHFAIIGVAFGIIERRKTITRQVITITILFIMFRIFRSEIYNFAKTFTWYYLYQILAILIFDKILSKYKKTNLKTSLGNEENNPHNRSLSNRNFIHGGSHRQRPSKIRPRCNSDLF